jgi:hypothetical protein
VAVDSDAVGNGITISAVKTGMGDALNTAPDQTSFYVQATILKPVIDIRDVEEFRDQGSTTASITFKQTVAHSAETWFIHLRYDLYPPSSYRKT